MRARLFLAIAGVVTVSGCALLGSRPPGVSCEYKVVSARHVIWTLKEGAAARRVTDQELLEHHTLKVTTRLRSTYTDELMWDKLQESGSTTAQHSRK